MYCAKTGEPINMPLVGLIHVNPGNNVLDWGPDKMNSFAPRGVTSQLCGFLPNYFGT